jgi:peroxidase
MNLHRWFRTFCAHSVAHKQFSQRRFRPDVEKLEERLQLSVTYRSFDGSGNNLANPDWGKAGTDLIRLASAAYGDGLKSPALATDKSARAISDILNSQAYPLNPSQDISTINQRSLSDFAYTFGQFMDHDLDLTPDGGASMPIDVPAGDPMGPGPLPFSRSQFDPTTGTTNARQQTTQVTAFLDLSQVYGSDPTKAAALRTPTGGFLKTSPDNMLPYDNSDYFGANPIAMANDGMLPLSSLFATGDVRGNENLELTALQTLFVRNHNRLVTSLQSQHSSWTDEQLFQEARKLNIAEYQSIVYNEWIPAVLGSGALTAYSGYKAGVDPSIANEFSTVAFRFGHSMLDNGIERQNNQGLPIADINPDGSDISLAQDFFDPTLLNPNGVLDPLTGHVSSDIGPILKGNADGVAQETDLLAVNSVRNLLFGNFGAGGQDLMARDVQRGRDNGIPDYNTLRVAMGLPAVTSFSQITKNQKVQAELKAAYGNINSIDAFEGGLAEDHVPGADVGPLFEAIMVNQFTRLRDGDSFFYLNEQFTRDELGLLAKGDTLAKVIEANTDVTNLQPNVFFYKATISGTVYLSQSGTNSRGQPGGAPGVIVQLKDDNGDVVATAITDRWGRYVFSQFSGSAADPTNSSGVSGTGYYQVVLLLPSWAKQTTANPASILISRGDTNVTGVDFGIKLSYPSWGGGTWSASGVDSLTGWEPTDFQVGLGWH